MNQIEFLILLRVRTVRRPAGITSRGPTAGRSLSIPQEGSRLEVAKQRIRAQQLTKQVPFSSFFVFSHFHFLVQLASKGVRLATDECSSCSNPSRTWRASRPGLPRLQIQPTGGWGCPPALPTTPIQQEPVHGQVKARGSQATI